MMVWEIFKKDVQLLWKLIAVVAAAEFVNSAIWLSVTHFGEPNSLFRITQFGALADWLGITVLIAMAVHQNAIPGDRQDWLIRPIRRRDLILAKLLFILIAVHGPMFLADLALGLGRGFPFWSSVKAVASHDLSLLLDLSLPMLAVAAMTSTLIEFLAGALVIGLTEAALVAAIPEFFFGGHNPPVVAGGMAWMVPAFTSAVALAAVFAIVPLQYFRRSTKLARAIALCAAVLAPGFMFVPWGPAFSLQQQFSADPAAARPIAIAFDPTIGRLKLEPGGQNRANSVWLPFRVSALPSDSMVISDLADFRVIGRDGAVLYQRTTGGRELTGFNGQGPVYLDDFPVRTITGGDVRTHQLISLPGKVYDLARNQPIRVELDYSLTLFRALAVGTISALDGDKRIADIGWCKTRIDNNGDSVAVGCINTGSFPTCITATLENRVSGQRNPTIDRCLPDYRPYTGHFDPNPMSNFRLGLSFRDPQGLAKYPVDSSQLSDARVLLKSYKPVAHFTRHITTPEIHLSDWAAETPQTATNETPPPRR